MTANILSAELSNIIQDSKKRNSDLKTAAEKALQELKALPATSEAQLAADLKRRPQFVDPLLLACNSRNAKLTLAAITCLQRLVVGNGLAVERLQEVLEAFQSSAATSLEVQLKILQSLPSISQNHANTLQGDLLALVLQVCTAIQQSKTSAVSNTAFATLQQIVSLVFERVEIEDGSPGNGREVHEIATNEGTLSVGSSARDAYRTLQDICLLTDEQKPLFIRTATISPTFGLEIIEMILVNHANVMHNHTEQGHLLSACIMPMINRMISEKLSFAITIRTLRILCILVREHIRLVSSECEIALGLLNQCLESDVSTPWRRAAAMEVFRMIYSSSEMLLDVYSEFDGAASEIRLIQSNLATFVRLAAEKPGVIGLGQQSSTPVTSSAAKGIPPEQGVLAAEAAVGIIGSDYGVNETNVPGISTALSTMKVPCLDQLDKLDGPSVPETYIYSLVLLSINALSDALAQVVLPLAMQHQRRGMKKSRSPAPPRQTLNADEQEQQEEKSDVDESNAPSSQRPRSRSVFVNPLDLKEHSAHASIATAADLISNCWPAVLAASSTFFNAALDADFYRSLVRSFQKFAQVAGILRLATPRDALLTTLAKVAVPPHLMKLESVPSFGLGQISPSLNKSHRALVIHGAETSSSAVIPDSPNKSRRSSMDVSGPTLSQRNMMCLRALVHLAIALGPILDQGWLIVLENIQKANVLLASIGTAATAQDYRVSAQAVTEPQSSQSSLASEIAAVEGAVTKLFASTIDYSPEAFKTVLVALCGLSGPQETPSASFNLEPPPKTSKRAPSVSGLTMSASLQPQYSHFAIAKLGELARVNMKRLSRSPQSEGWELLFKTLNEISTSSEAEISVRQIAADVLCKVAAGSSIGTSGEDTSVRKMAQERSFAALMTAIQSLYRGSRGGDVGNDTDIHQLFLGSLRAILEHCGETIVTGWDTILKIIDSAFFSQDPVARHAGGGSRASAALVAQPRSAKLCKISFASIQLVCSDFLDTLPSSCLTRLIDIMSQFCSQQLDMNISLSAITLFWNISDQLGVQGRAHDALTYGEHEETKSATTSIEAEASDATAWSLLLNRLASLTNDERADVRNGTAQTLFRTLDSSDEKLMKDKWNEVFYGILAKVLEIDTQRQKQTRATGDSIDQEILKALNQTTRIILEGCVKLLTYSPPSDAHDSPDTSSIWPDFLRRLAFYLDCESYEIEAWIYSSITQLLSVLDDAVDNTSLTAVHEVAALWARAIPKAQDSPENDAQAQDKAHQAYVGTIQRVHALLHHDLQHNQIKLIIDRLEEVIRVSKATPYTNDVNKQTKLQSEVLRTFEQMSVGNAVPSIRVLEGLANFVVFPYAQGKTSSRSHQGLTFVAFAKASTVRLQTIVEQHGHALVIVSDRILPILMDALVTSMERKYTWSTQGQDPKIWCQATTTALAIIKQVMPGLKNDGTSDQNSNDIWTRIIRVSNAIQDAIYESRPKLETLLVDEEFDLNSLDSCLKLVTPYLRDGAVNEDLRRAYVAGLHRTSTIHPSRFDDIDLSDGFPVTHGPPASATSSTQTPRNTYRLDLGTPLPANLTPRTPGLADVKSIRRGLVYEPPFNPRIRICYAALDHLFDLVSASGSKNLHEQPRQNLSLARTALPFLLHRITVPLRRYVADQPLRGRLPTPESQRLELLHILEKILVLTCVDVEIDVGDGLKQHGPKAHLKFVAPLVVKTLGVVGPGDKDIRERLLAVLDAVMSS